MTIKEYRKEFIELYNRFSNEHEIKPHVEVFTGRAKGDIDCTNFETQCRIYLDER